jgi:hypothetical protein
MRKGETVGSELAADTIEPVAYGIDDITLGFDMEGSRGVRVLNAAPGVVQRRGKMLGEAASWGKWSHLLGRSVAHWQQDTKRLYVQAKVAPFGALCAPGSLAAEVAALIERMAAVGIVSYEPPWVTRLDVAVDARCRPDVGKLILDGLEAVRPPNGWRTRGVGTPRSTVYFMARASEKVQARAYCRNLESERRRALRADPVRGVASVRSERSFAGEGAGAGVCRDGLEAALRRARWQGCSARARGASGEVS